MCSILLYQNKTGESGIARAINPQLACESRKPLLPIRRDAYFSAPEGILEPGNSQRGATRTPPGPLLLPKTPSLRRNLFSVPGNGTPLLISDTSSTPRLFASTSSLLCSGPVACWALPRLTAALAAMTLLCASGVPQSEFFKKKTCSRKKTASAIRAGRSR